MLWRLSIDIMFLLYKFYIISPNLITLLLNSPITENFLNFYIFKKTSLTMIYKLFSSL